MAFYWEALLVDIIDIQARLTINLIFQAQEDFGGDMKEQVMTEDLFLQII